MHAGSHCFFCDDVHFIVKYFDLDVLHVDYSLELYALLIELCCDLVRPIDQWPLTFDLLQQYSVSLLFF